MSGRNPKAKSRHEQQDWDLTCDMCGRAFPKQQSLHRHLAAKHGTVVSTVEEVSHASPSGSQTLRTDVSGRRSTVHWISTASVLSETKKPDSVNTDAPNHIIYVDDRTTCAICRQTFDNNACLARHLQEKHSGLNGESGPGKEKRCLIKNIISNASKTGNSGLSDFQILDSESCIQSTSGRPSRDGILACTSDQQSVLCGLCDMSFTTSNELEVHNSLLHNAAAAAALARIGTNSVPCPFCTARVGNSELKTHVVCVHKDIARTCPSCYKILTLPVLVKHVQSCKDLPNQKFEPRKPKCSLCEEDMYGKSYKQYLSHMYSHGSQRISCTVCRVSFPQESDLESHLPIHQPFSLDRPAHRSHQVTKSHLRAEKVTCAICRQIFGNYACLARHLHEEHTGRWCECRTRKENSSVSMQPIQITDQSGPPVANPNQTVPCSSNQIAGATVSAPSHLLADLATPETVLLQSGSVITEVSLVAAIPASSGSLQAFLCVSCNQFLPVLKDVRNHSLLQDGSRTVSTASTSHEGSVTCPFCPVQVAETGLKPHVISSHFNIYRTCPGCYEMKSVSVLVEHVEACLTLNSYPSMEKKSGKLGEPICALCNEVMWGKSYYQYLNHMYSHEKPSKNNYRPRYACTICLSDDLSENRLKAHLFMHQPFSLDTNDPKNPAQVFELVHRPRPRIPIIDAARNEENSQPSTSADEANCSKITPLLSRLSEVLGRPVEASSTVNSISEPASATKHAQSSPHLLSSLPIRQGGSAIATSGQLGTIDLESGTYKPNTETSDYQPPRGTYKPTTETRDNQPPRGTYKPTTETTDNQPPYKPEPTIETPDNRTPRGTYKPTSGTLDNQPPRGTYKPTTETPDHQPLTTQLPQSTLSGHVSETLNRALVCPQPWSSTAAGSPIIIPHTSHSDPRVSDNPNSRLSNAPSLRLEQQIEKVRDTEQVFHSQATSSQGPYDVRRTCDPFAPDVSNVSRSYNQLESSSSAAQVCPEPGPSTEAGSSMIIPSPPARFLSPTRGSVPELVPSESDPDELAQCLYCHYTSRQSNAIRSHYFLRHSRDGPQARHEYSRLDRYLMVHDQRIAKIEEQKRELKLVKERLDEQQRMFNARLDEQSRIVQQHLDQVDEQIQQTLRSKQNALRVSEQNPTVSSTISDEVCIEPEFVQQIVPVPDSSSRAIPQDQGQKPIVPVPDPSIASNGVIPQHQGQKPIVPVPDPSSRAIPEDQGQKPIVGPVTPGLKEVSTPSRSSDPCSDTIKLRCRICSEPFDNEKAFIKHVRRKHPDDLKSQQKKHCSSVTPVKDTNSVASNTRQQDTQPDAGEVSPKKKRKCEIVTEAVDETEPTFTLTEASQYCDWKLKPCSVKIVDCHRRAKSFRSTSSPEKRKLEEKVPSLMQEASKTVARISASKDVAVVEDKEANYRTAPRVPTPVALTSDCDTGVDSDRGKILKQSNIDLNPSMSVNSCVNPVGETSDAQPESCVDMVTSMCRHQGDVMNTGNDFHSSEDDGWDYGTSDGVGKRDKGSDEDSFEDTSDTTCPVCSKVLLDEVRIKDHMVGKHSKTITGEQYLMRCPGCDFSSTTFIATHSHIVQEHGADEEALAELQRERESQEYKEIVRMAYQFGKKRKQKFQKVSSTETEQENPGELEPADGYDVNYAGKLQEVVLEPASHSCPICNSVFDGESQLKAHITETHSLARTRMPSPAYPTVVSDDEVSETEAAAMEDEDTADVETADDISVSSGDTDSDCDEIYHRVRTGIDKECPVCKKRYYGAADTRHHVIRDHSLELTGRQFTVKCPVPKNNRSVTCDKILYSCGQLYGHVRICHNGVGNHTVLKALRAVRRSSHYLEIMRLALGCSSNAENKRSVLIPKWNTQIGNECPVCQKRYSSTHNTIIHIVREHSLQLTGTQFTIQCPAPKSNKSISCDMSFHSCKSAYDHLTRIHPDADPAALEEITARRTSPHYLEILRLASELCQGKASIDVPVSSSCVSVGRECPLCEKQYHVKRATEHHIIANHSLDMTGSQFTVPCTICGRTFHNVDCVYQHIRSMHVGHHSKSAATEAALHVRDDPEYLRVLRLAYEGGQSSGHPINILSMGADETSVETLARRAGVKLKPCSVVLTDCTMANVRNAGAKPAGNCNLK